MATKKLNGSKMTKKIARQLVYDKLVLALSDLKPETKNKKFENRLRETSKVFAAYVIKSTDKDKIKSETGTKKEVKTNQDSAGS
jgi:hypothetical protein